MILQTKILLVVFPGAMEIMRPVEQILGDSDGFCVEHLPFTPGSTGDSAGVVDSINSAGARACVVVVAPVGGLPDVARFLENVTAPSPRAPILIVSGDTDSSQILTLLRLGASDFASIESSASDLAGRLWGCLQNAAKGSTSVTRVDKIPEKVSDAVVGESPVFLKEMKRAEQASRCDVSVFISGETGTGKEVCARTIHRLSERRSKPFVPINGGAIPVDLIENELFGHAKEAFTGASSARQGLIAAAEGGTLFIDEVDCFPPQAQVKLLRFLQEKEYRPLGTRKICNANVRVLAATNSDVGRLLTNDRLRSDLYYRLNTIPITLPPLRERQEDIMPLAFHFLSRYVRLFGADYHDFSPQARLKLQHHQWPGNVRELEQTVQRAIVLSPGGSTMDASAIQFDGAESPQAIRSFQDAKAQVIADFEENFLKNALRAFKGNITHAAEASGKNRRAFWELMRKYGIDADDYRVDNP